MSQRRIAVLLVGLAVLGLMTLFPPWVYTCSWGGVNAERAAGFCSLFSPPEPEVDSPAFGVKLALGQLLAQYVALAMGVGALLLVFREREG